MDSAYISAFTGLAGVLVGGLTSFFTSYFTQTAQLRERSRETERAKREALYGDFITEASRLYGDALSHEKDDVADLVLLYALIARMRLIGSREVVRSAEQVLGFIVETYLAPNRSLRDLRDVAKSGEMNFLSNFGEACRADLEHVHRGRRNAFSEPGGAR